MITILFGPPGSGKGTQAQVISKRFGLPHVSTGQMLRDEVGAGSEVGREAEPIMKSGGLISDDLMVRIIEHRLGQPDAQHGVLLDGFPRTVPQAHELDEMLERTGREIGVVLFFDVPEEELKKRIERRSEIDHRADDTPEAYVQRRREYEEKSAPVIGYYEDRGTRIEYVNGNAPIDTVTESILTIFGGQLPARGVA
ncbi:MAG: adenylate kinase [Candidatus Dormibacteraeota bacterium]|uniref:Adenylate kinase n=1 Tax=Candidatus Aeolococcus gillhamiae TaxID=3127015 RepID=A0A2W6AC61_9BACT|nr:adenylate kinase [Candidatus Dormibacteraeota bacterium]PZR81104.1 MAG: adenylate kinase [Candidatus Dormibacter sp. RRmetagenome_bin12]